MVHCLRDDELLDYIIKKRASKALSAAEVDTLARAFAGLAGMDSGFREQDSEPSQRKEAEHALSAL